MNHFALEAAKEIFSDSVIVRITLAGHALVNTMLIKELSVHQRSVLDAAVAVEDETWRGAFPANRHFQSVCGQRGVKAARECVANNLLRA